MASAVLPSRNEAHYMRKFTTSSNFQLNSRFNPSPNLNPTRHLVHNVSAPFSQSSNDGREYVTYNLASYSKNELKCLKKRLINDLERVRAVIKRVEGARNEPLNQALGLATGGKESKRRRVVQRDSMMSKCKQILMKLMKHKHGWVFNTPVDVKGLKLYDYYDIIKNPMDLGTVKLRLERKEYGTITDFAADVRLTFNNALTYNPKGQDVHHMAEMLLADFENMFKPVNNKYPKVATVKQRILSQAALIPPPNVNQSHSTLFNQHQFQVHNMIPPPPRPVITPRSGKLPKPKAKDPNKREMTFQEKSKLGQDLQNLPIEKMEQVVLIVKRRNPNLAQEGDEIELDFEALDSETLWELDRFITYHKKAVSQMKKQGITEDVAPKELNKLPQKAPTPEHVMHITKKGGEVWEEDVDIGDEIAVENFPPVQIDKDAPCVSSRSSSSSSSSSGSDSSSSDSGSSSGSDSDEDSVQSPFVEAKQAPTT